jgi:two-component system, OmpR family, sensor histidine kinase KdpD
MHDSRRLGTEDREMARLVEREASRLSSLTDRLLRLARLDREEVKTRLRSSDITALVKRVANRYSTQFTEHRISITCPIGLVEAPADRELLDLAVTQLLDNAFKYSAPESPVAIEIDLQDEGVSIRVRNEGSPIAPLERDRIFERFYRGADVRNQVSGAGLGLHVARKIAAAHGGTLDLDPSASGGTVVFCLKLPTSAVGRSHVPSHN